MTELLQKLTEHFPLVAIGCVEILAAVILLGALPHRKLRMPKHFIINGEAEAALMKELESREGNACIVLRRSDLLPVLDVGHAENLIGVSLSDLQQDIANALPCLSEPQEGKTFWKAYLAWDGAAPLRSEISCKNQKRISLEMRRSEDGAYDFLFLRDKTLESQKIHAYEEQLSQAESASQFKTSFLFRMSHEIRTPMNGINGMLILAEGKLPPDHPAMQYLTKANELSDHLLSLINDILDMSRIEAGKIKLENSAFSLRELGNKLYDMFARTCESKGIGFSVVFDQMEADWVIGDELRISQVIINFISNAVKFTGEGEVTVTFRQMMRQQGRADFMVCVRDTGIGMQPEFMSRIFHPFEQEDASTTRRFGGTGLGMAITDQLVKLMGGQIVVESQPGKGSSFTTFLSLPMAAAPAATEQKETAKPQGDWKMQRCRILLAEDNEVNAMIAVELLGEKGAEVEVAQNGEIALQRFIEKGEDYYDLILMDIQMPVMDGHAAARAIRALSRADAATVPIFALSADAFVEDERLSLESGMNGHIAKPIDFEALWKTIGDAMRGKEVRKS